MLKNLLRFRPIGCAQFFHTSCYIRNSCEKQSTKPSNLIKSYFELGRFSKPTGTWLLYLPCTWGIAVATPPGQLPDFYMLALFGIGSILMRSAGCTINDMWDQKYDKLVKRTKDRPLASGSLTYFQALSFLGLQLSASLVILLQLNWYRLVLTLLQIISSSVFLGFLSMVPVTTYPLFKRFTYWPQLVLGLTLNWGVWLGYSAINGFCLFSVCAPLYLAAVFWTCTYDTIYSHQSYVDFMYCLVFVLFASLVLPRKPVAPFHCLTFNWGALLGYSAVVGYINPYVTFPLYLAGLNWTMIYDTIYAHQDIDDDIRIGVKSTAILFGENTKPYLALFHTGMTACLLTVGINADAGCIYYLGTLGTMLHIAHLIRKVDLKNPTCCWQTFKASRTSGLLYFLTIALDKICA